MSTTTTPAPTDALAPSHSNSPVPPVRRGERAVVRKDEGRGSAFFAVLLGAIVMLVFVLVLQGEVLPNVERAGRGLLAIFGVSISLILAGFMLSWRDARRLAREWAALEGLKKSREVVLVQHPQTAVGERVQFVQDAIDTRRVRPGYREAWRADAATALMVGSHTRFVASALLVLCVIGTFAGMKGALPALIDAISAATTAAGASGMTNALDRVADAFGANFIALLGSLALGGAAYGAAFERRAVLRKLERESERRLYPDVPQGADASALQQAVDKLDLSVQAVRGVGDSIARLESGISGLRTTLRDTLTEMHSSFSDSVRQHSVELQEQLNTTVAGLSATLGQTSKALQLTAVSYEGMARGMEERDLGIRQATQAFEVHSARALQAAVSLEQAAVSSNQTATTVANLAAESQRALAQTLADARQAAERVESAITAQAITLAALQGELSGARRDLGGIAEGVLGVRDGVHAVRDGVGQTRDGLSALQVSMEASDARLMGRLEELPAAVAAPIIAPVVAGLSALGSDAREARILVAALRTDLQAGGSRLTAQMEQLPAAIAAPVVQPLVARLASLGDEVREQTAEVRGTTQGIGQVVHAIDAAHREHKELLERQGGVIATASREGAARVGESVQAGLADTVAVLAEIRSRTDGGLTELARTLIEHTDRTERSDAQANETLQHIQTLLQFPRDGRSGR